MYCLDGPGCLDDFGVFTDWVLPRWDFCLSIFDPADSVVAGMRSSFCDEMLEDVFLSLVVFLQDSILRLVSSFESDSLSEIDDFDAGNPELEFLCSRSFLASSIVSISSKTPAEQKDVLALVVCVIRSD